MSAPRIADLQQVLEAGAAAGIPGLSAAVANRQGVQWTGTAGLSIIQAHEPVRPDMLFGIGSITKTFVAVVVLQLIEEGRLRLEDTPAHILGSAVDGIANADRAAIPELLNHTSGVRSWEDDPVWIREGRGAKLDVERAWGRTDTLAYIRGQPPLAAPGEKYSYSNSNHTLLGLMIEKVTGESVVAQIHARIREPLGLKDVYLDGFEPVPQGRFPHRYHWSTPEFVRDAGVNPAFTPVRPDLIDATGSNLSVEWAAGGIVATASELARYGAALRAGKLLPASSMQLMTRWRAIEPPSEVGHGLFRESRPEGFALIGHNGDVLGFSANLYWIEGTDVVVAAMCNVGTMHSGTVPRPLSAVVRSREFVEAVSDFATERARA